MIKNTHKILSYGWRSGFDEIVFITRHIRYLKYISAITAHLCDIDVSF